MTQAGAVRGRFGVPERVCAWSISVRCPWVGACTHTGAPPGTVRPALHAIGTPKGNGVRERGQGNGTRG